MAKYETGDRVVYQKSKVSSHPSPRAEDVRPAPHGDDYSYAIEKYWTVSDVIDENTIEVVTRTGKRHRLKVTDPSLRKASAWELLRKQDDFPELPPKRKE